MEKVSKVFISYRREDAADIAGRIRDRIVQKWGLSKDNVFMDVETILAGQDFMQVIDQRITHCQAMIILISPSWLRQVNTPGISYVRLEAEAALRQQKLKVIPVLVGGARQPREEDLPESLRPLTRLNIRPIRSDAFEFDIDAVRKGLGVRLGPGTPLIAAISVLAVVVLVAGTLSQTPPGNPIYNAVHQVGPTATEGPTATLQPTFTPVPAHITLALQSNTITTDASASVDSPESVTAHCGNAGTLIGGGYYLYPIRASGFPVADAWATASYPSGGDGWTVSSANPGYGVVALAYCAQANFSLQVQIVQQVSGVDPVCPAGAVAISGGANAGGKIIGSYPNASDTSWQTELYYGSSQSGHVYSICATSGFSVGQVITQSTTGVDTTVQASCPTGQVMAGGGFKNGFIPPWSPMLPLRTSLAGRSSQTTHLEISAQAQSPPTPSASLSQPTQAELMSGVAQPG